jgi:hypothetical protein
MDGVDGKPAGSGRRSLFFCHSIYRFAVPGKKVNER